MHAFLLWLQRILDEAVLGSYMESPDCGSHAPTAGHKCEQRPGQGPKEVDATALGADQGAKAGSMGSGFEAAGQHSLNNYVASLTTGAAAMVGLPPASASPSIQQLSRYDQPQFEQHGTPAPAQLPTQQHTLPAGAEDLLTMDASSSSNLPSVAADGEDDLLGFSGAALETTASSMRASAASSTAHIDDLFSIPPSRRAAGVADAPPIANRAGSRTLDSIIDLGNDLPDVDTAGFSELYKEAQVSSRA